jgi:hypothetical protein
MQRVVALLARSELTSSNSGTGQTMRLLLRRSGWSVGHTTLFLVE